MTQAAINMHTSQISHGYVKGDDYLATADNVVVTGYPPSMIRLMLLAGNEPVARVYWYETDPSVMFYEDYGSPAPSQESVVFEITERGFVLDGVAVSSLNSDVDGFFWETFGCFYDGTYRTHMNPDPKDGDCVGDPDDQPAGWDYLPDVDFDGESGD